MANIVYPKLTGWVGVPPYPRFLHANEPWDADDPFVKDNPEFFGDAPQAEPRRSVPVEQATAAPGEKRNVHVPDAEADAELLDLRTKARNAGVKVDKRWGADRLREEIENAGG